MLSLRISIGLEHSSKRVYRVEAKVEEVKKSLDTYKVSNNIRRTGVAYSKNNPFSIRRRDKEYVKYKTPYQGIEAGKRLIGMYVDGSSRYTDSTTTFIEAIRIYVGHDRHYGYKACKRFDIKEDALISDVGVELMVRCILYYENIWFYKEYYLNNKYKDKEAKVDEVI